jgi:hypothetical protein
MVRLRLSLRGSIVARLAVGYGLLVALSVAVLSTVFYFGTVGVFERSMDNKIQAIALRLASVWNEGGDEELVRQIDLQLHDRIDSDTELVGLLDAGGRRLAGNLPPWDG